jgi:hypothetical protein
MFYLITANTQASSTYMMTLISIKQTMEQLDASFILTTTRSDAVVSYQNN